MMGLLQVSHSDWMAWRPANLDVDEEEIDRLITARLDARRDKNWAEADRIRNELAAKGVQLKDAKDPATGEIVTTWEVAR